MRGALLSRRLPALLWGVLLDRPPSAALEHILSNVGQSLGLRTEEDLLEQARLYLPCCVVLSPYQARPYSYPTLALLRRRDSTGGG